MIIGNMMSKKRRQVSGRRSCTFVFGTSFLWCYADAWVPLLLHDSAGPIRHCRQSTTSAVLPGGKVRHMTAPSQNEPTSDVVTIYDDDEKPAGIEGAQFFGGNKRKEEFFDPAAEANAAVDDDVTTVFDRFADTMVFRNDASRQLGRCLQSQINQILYQSSTSAINNDDDHDAYRYAASVQWTSPFHDARTATTPWAALQQARDFYRDIHVAITKVTVVVENEMALLRWEISVAWPTLGAPRVLLTGQSQLTLRHHEIVGQQDQVDGGNENVMSVIAGQLRPRLWDMYHIGMTPSAERAPRIIAAKSASWPLLAPYTTYELPPRWMLQCCLTDTSANPRVEATAAFVPNHAFGCVIKTMGPTKQRYVPVSPLEVQINVPRNGGGGGGDDDDRSSNNQIVWNIPLSVEFQAVKAEWKLPAATSSSTESCQYVWHERRWVATAAFGGTPQDEGIAAVRRQLYEAVLRDDTFQPKLDANGRPLFSFWTHGAKLCYTDEGLGMAVYEWRPQFSKPNEIVLELEPKQK